MLRSASSSVLALLVVSCASAPPPPLASPIAASPPAPVVVVAAADVPEAEEPASEASVSEAVVTRAPVEGPALEEPARDAEEPEAPDPAVEPWDRPFVVSDAVRARVREIAAVRARNDDVFIKVGDSATVARPFMRCFSTEHGVDLGGREDLRPTIERIRAARVRGGTSFNRSSEAAGVGWNANTPLRGDPSHLSTEVRALGPRFALVMFGGNDIELGRLGRYRDRMTSLVERLEGWGVVPILSTIPRRLDDPEADEDVPRYNAVVRELARARRLPLVDIAPALDVLPGHGISSDRMHPSAPVREGRAYGCDLSEQGVRHGQNIRNLMNLRALEALHVALREDGESPE